MKSLSHYCYLYKLRRLLKLQIEVILNITFPKSLKFSQYLISTLEYIKIIQTLALYRQNSEQHFIFSFTLILRYIRGSHYFQ